MKIGEVVAGGDSEFKVLVEPSFDRDRRRSPMVHFFKVNYLNLKRDLLLGYKRTFIGGLCLGKGVPLAEQLGLQQKQFRVERISNRNRQYKIFPFFKHSDQTVFRTEWRERTNSTMNKHFGNLLVSLSAEAPDGMVVVFPDFSYIEQLVAEWSKLGIVDELCKRKLLFIDSRDRVQNRFIFNAYRDAIAKGRGAALFTNFESPFLKGISLIGEACRTCVFFGLGFDVQSSKVGWVQCQQLRRNYGVDLVQHLQVTNYRRYLQFMHECVRDSRDSCCFVIVDIRFSNQNASEMPSWMLNQVECNELFDKDKFISTHLDSEASPDLRIQEENASVSSLEDFQEHWGFEISEGLDRIRKFILNLS